MVVNFLLSDALKHTTWHTLIEPLSKHKPFKWQKHYGLSDCLDHDLMPCDCNTWPVFKGEKKVYLITPIISLSDHIRS